jgi:hypothetical protein
VYWKRLERDGWTLRSPGRFTWVGRKYRTEQPEIWEKPERTGSPILTMKCVGLDSKALGGPYLMEYFLKRSPTAPEVSIDGATWAEWDQRGRLVFARAGKLFATWVHNPQELSPKELADFNDQRPESLKAPASAIHW